MHMINWELFHCDLCCMNKPSLEGAKYIIFFKIFKDFMELDENKCGSPIKCLRLDNGGEYVSQKIE